MTFARYHSFAPQRVHNDIGRAFVRFFGAEAQPSADASAWTPRVDVKEEETRFVILADVPGVDPQSIQIDMDKGVLTIRGERAAEAPAEGSGYTRSERVHGKFERRFVLPDSADAEGVSASGKHGVLEIAIPKKPQSAPRRINVNA
jgi:HSP20 family protein